MRLGELRAKGQSSVKSVAPLDIDQKILRLTSHPIFNILQQAQQHLAVTMNASTGLSLASLFDKVHQAALWFGVSGTIGLLSFNEMTEGDSSWLINRVNIGSSFMPRKMSVSSSTSRVAVQPNGQKMVTSGRATCPGRLLAASKALGLVPNTPQNGSMARRRALG